ncbi:MAG: AraC family transcriptional regulator [Lachnospiraceae bacterium]|nr:AraC family transcriptional regulator [Lachnospiraceae bacterium]
MKEKTGKEEKMYQKRGYLLSDFRLFHLNDVQGTEVEYHYHDFHKLLFLRSGVGEYMIEGAHYNLKSGDIVLIGSKQVHRPEFEKGTPYERLILYISPEFLKKNSTEGCLLEEIFYGNDTNFSHVLRSKGKERERLFALTEKLEKELAEEVYGTEIACKGLLLRLLVELGRAVNCAANEEKERRTYSTRVREMMRYLEEHLGEEITIETLSDHFYVSKYHMMRQFKEETGQSVYDYLTERRLLHARELMKKGISATESSFRSGFSSYSSFTRAYAKRFGTTPTGRIGRNMKREETYE